MDSDPVYTLDYEELPNTRNSRTTLSSQRALIRAGVRRKPHPTMHGRRPPSLSGSDGQNYNGRHSDLFPARCSNNLPISAILVTTFVSLVDTNEAVAIKECR